MYAIQRALVANIVTVRHDCVFLLLPAMTMTLCTPFEGHVLFFGFVLWPLLVLNIAVLLWGAITCNLNTTNFIIMLAATTG